LSHRCVARGFDFVGADAKRALMSACSSRFVNNNQIIYLQDDETSNLYFVYSGLVRLSYFMEDGSAVLCDVISSGACFGELGVLDGGSYGDMAMSIGASTILSVPAEVFWKLCEAHAELKEALAASVAYRYRSYIEFARLLSLKSLRARVARSLLRITDNLGKVATYNGSQVPCTIPEITQTDLGLMARGSRSGVNRVLNEWVQKGMISIRERTVLIINRDAIEDCGYEGDI